jgi:hypothetical protein
MEKNCIPDEGAPEERGARESPTALVREVDFNVAISSGPLLHESDGDKLCRKKTISTGQSVSMGMDAAIYINVCIFAVLDKSLLLLIIVGAVASMGILSPVKHKVVLLSQIPRGLRRSSEH